MNLAGRAIRRTIVSGPDHPLAALVAQGKFNNASALLTDLRHALRDIPPSTIYEHAALHVLNDTGHGVPERDKGTKIAMWMSLWPDANKDEQAVPHRLLDALLRHPVSRENAIRRLAVVLAEKGYVDLVREKLLPVLSGSVEHEVRLLLQPTRLSPSDSDDVFEEERGAEYRSAYDEDDSWVLRPMPPTTITTLHELLLSLTKESYTIARRMLFDLRELDVHIPPHPIFQLPALFVIGSPSASDDHIIFSPEERIREFELWFSFYPSASSDVGGGPRTAFMKLSQYIFFSPITNLPLIQSFGLICASKGYFAASNNSVIPAVMRYALPAESFSFLSKYEAATRHFLEGKGHAKLVRELGKIRGLAIRSFSATGRLDEALQVLIDTSSEVRLEISPRDLSRLLFRVLHSPVQTHRNCIPLLRSLISEIEERNTKFGHGDAYRELDMLVAAEQSSLIARLHNTSFVPRLIDDFASLAHMLRFIKSRIHSKDSQSLPHTETLVSFFDAYNSLRSLRPSHTPTTALRLLQTHALRAPHSFRARSLLLFAQMIYLYRLLQHHSLLRVFMENFYMQGVPRMEILDALNKAGEMETVGQSGGAGKGGFGDDGNIYSQYSYDIGSVVLPPPVGSTPTKLFPNRLHISLVWQSLAHLAPTPSRLVTLWDRLVGFARASSDTSSPDVSEFTNTSDDNVQTLLNLQRLDTLRSPMDNLPPLLTPPVWTSQGGLRLGEPGGKVDTESNSDSETVEGRQEQKFSPIIAECFTPFIIKLMRASNPPRAWASGGISPSQFETEKLNFESPTIVLRTLISLGLAPTIHHFTEMARWWAWHGEEKKMLVVLERLEANRRTDRAVKDAQEEPRQIRDDGAAEDSSRDDEAGGTKDGDIRPRSSLVTDTPQSPANTLPEPDFILYIALMRAVLASPHYRDRDSIPEPSSGVPGARSVPPHTDQSGTRRRLMVLSELYSRFEKRFGADALQESQNGYLHGVMRDWRALEDSLDV